MKAIVNLAGTNNFSARSHHPCSQTRAHPKRVTDVFFKIRRQSRPDQIADILFLENLSVSYTRMPSETACRRLARNSRAVSVINVPETHPSESLNGAQDDSENVHRSFMLRFSLATQKQIAELFDGSA